MIDIIVHGFIAPIIMRYRKLFFLASTLTSTIVFSETIPSIEINNIQKDLAYLINGPEVVVGSDYQDACKYLKGYGYTWKIIPTTDINEACYSGTDQKIMGTDTWYCADGSLAYNNVPWWYCPAFRVCPNPSWTLSSDKLNCTRPILECSATPETVSEMQLLAAIVYAEATPHSTFEEKAAIANAIIRYKNYNGYKTVNELIKDKHSYSSSVLTNAERYLLAMCSNVEIEYPQVYDAVKNALDPEGIDYANGGCFWDGYDLVTQGKKQLHYSKGYKFTKPTHDIFGIGNSDPAHKITADKKKYNFTYQSTAAYGHTVFWRLTDEFLTATRGKQCH